MQKKYYKNHIIRKKWGQIFLHDNKVIGSIINIINPEKSQTIVEIGPGLGALTKPILNIVDFLIVIERDKHLVNHLIRTFHCKQIKIFHQDVMKMNFSNLSDQFHQKLRLIGNLPYNISTKLILSLYKYIDVIHDMHFMFQKEVGQRIIASPNNKQYGRLSIITQYYCKVHALINISKTSFIPMPKVESMMIHFIPYHNHNPFPHVKDIKLLSLLTQLAFHQRRKSIRNSLSSCFNTVELMQTGIDITARAENLTIHEFCILANILYNKNK